MTTQEQINEKEARMLELARIMSESDAHAAKCIKLGLKFSTAYPDQLAAYKAAREEYNQIETELATLREQLENEREEIREEPLPEE